MDDLTGRSIRGYELRERIGSGGFGAVYLAHQPVVKREVAIKIILPERASRPEFIRRFETEAQLVARLEHLHIVPLYDYWRDPDGAYLVMRWLRGGSLQDALKHGSWSVARTQKLLNQIAAALAVSHRSGVIHRDIKPANILLDEEGNAFLSDFGIAKEITRLPEADSNEGFFGSPAYVSPEQVLREQIGPQSDIYSLGIVLYELLTGRRPFSGNTDTTLLRLQVSSSLPSLREARPDLPSALDIVLRRATAKYPDARHRDVLELAADFQRVADITNQAKTRRLSTPDADISLPILLDPDTVDLQLDDTSDTRQLANTDTRRLPDLDDDDTQDITHADQIETSGPATHHTYELGALTLEVLEPRNPFKGLRPFDEADSSDFFGRDKLTRHLLTRLTEPVRLLAIVGPSGSGKSSVVRAGVLPALRYESDWYIAQMTPGAQPFIALQEALGRIAVTLPDDLNVQLASDPARLNAVVGEILPDADSQLLLLIDQFEEIFTQTTDPVLRAAFLDGLVNAAQDKRIYIVLTLRADFYDQPLLYPAFGELIRQRTEVVLPLNDAERRAAITAPAERVGLTVEPALVDAILHDVSAQPGALPLLQYALTELYERRDNLTLTLTAYEAIGGVSGALARRADDIFSALDSDEQTAARQLFLRLVTPGEGTDDTRRRVWQSELDALNDAAVPRLIAILGQYRLLTFDRDPATRAPTVELAHEALIRQWVRLRQWLAENREALQSQRRLAQATGEWLRMNQDASFLATGSRLAQFESLVSGEVALNADEKAYLTASLSQRAQAENRRRLMVVGLALFALFALALALFAFDRQRRAEAERLRADQQAAVATSRELAVTALTNLDDHLDRALLLSLEALKSADTLEARNSLLTALAAEPHLVSYLHGDGLPVRSVAIDPTGQYVVAGGESGIIQRWNLMTLQPMGDPLTGHTNWINDLTFNPDGILLASASADQTVRLWDADSGDLLREFSGHESAVRAVAMSGNLLASGGDDQIIRLWDVESGDLLYELAGHEDIIFDLAFDPAGERLASASGDGTIRLWDVDSGNLLRELTGHEDFVLSVAFNADGGLLVSGSADNTIRLWDTVSGIELNQFRGHSNWVRSVVVSDQTLISASADQTVRLWQLMTGQPLDTPYTGHTNTVWSITVSGDTIVSGGADSNLLVWNRAAQLSTVVGQQAEAVSALALHGKLLASANGNPTGTGDDNAILLWNRDSSGEPVRFEGHERSVTSIAYSPNGEQLVSGSVDQTVRIWEVALGTSRVLNGHTDAVMSVAVRPDGEQIASGGFDNVIRLWNAAISEPVGDPLTGHTDAVLSVAYSSDGVLLASGSFDGTARLWSADTGAPVGDPLTGHTDAVMFVTFSPDSQRLVTTSRDGTARVWNLATGDSQIFTGHSNWVLSAAFHPTEPILTTGSRDHTLRLWDLTTGRPIGQPLAGHTDWVSALVFDAAGQFLYSGGHDTTILRWPVSLSDWTRRACQIANRNLTAAESQQYLRTAFGVDTCSS